jgi:proteasome lid subunit RPN8/RPN11
MDIRRLDGELLHQEVLVPDWEPAVEWTRLAGLRTHGIWAQGSGAEPRLEPLWHTTVGAPVIEGFRIHLCQDGVAWFADFRMGSYFADAARAAVDRLVTDRRVQEADRVQYVVAAFAKDSDSDVDRSVRFQTSEQPGTCSVAERPIARLVSQSHDCGEPDIADINVVMPDDVLAEIYTCAREAGRVETGGILIGHLCRDPETHDVGVEITAQIRARHTVADAARLTFTSETWTDVRAAVALRRAHELMVGWWHLHPAHAWCEACPVERQQVCRLASGFLSPEDRSLHRAMFPRAFATALVVTNSISGLHARLFGWRNGVLEPRGFRLMRGAGSDVGQQSELATHSSHEGNVCQDANAPISRTLNSKGCSNDSPSPDLTDRP